MLSGKMVFLPTHCKQQAKRRQRDASKLHVRKHVLKAQRKLTRIQKIQRNRYPRLDLCQSAMTTMMRAHATQLGNRRNTETNLLENLIKSIAVVVVHAQLVEIRLNSLFCLADIHQCEREKNSHFDTTIPWSAPCNVR